MYILATKSKKNITKWYQETLLKCKFNTPSVYKLKNMEIKHACSFRQLSNSKMTSIREKGDTLRLKYDNENHINNCHKNFDHIGKLNNNPCIQHSLCNTNFDKILYKKINQSKHSQTNFSHQSDYLKELSQLSSMMLPHLKQSSIKRVSCWRYAFLMADVILNIANLYLYIISHSNCNIVILVTLKRKQNFIPKLGCCK